MLLVFLFLSCKSLAQPNRRAWQWADSVYQAMTPKERLGQLFMVAAYSNKGPEHQEEIEKLVRDHGIGGLIFFQGGPQRQARLTNQYQTLGRIPLLIGMDAEWGLAMRLDSTISFPKQQTLGALDNPELIRDMGEAIGRHCRRLGVHVSFSPVVDINSNPSNPVIGNRAFGEDREQVLQRAALYMKGLQSQGVLAVAKHFPGHGDTETDSHLGLPTISKPYPILKEMELYPYRKLMEDSLQAIMVGHLHLPSLDPTPNLPASLSRELVHGLLQRELGFSGLVFTDALNMKGVTQHFPPGDAEIRAFLAGNDILLFPENVPVAIQGLEQALAKRKIRWRDIEKRVRKVLAWKYAFGLSVPRQISAENLTEDLNPVRDQLLVRKLYAGALTVVRNKDRLLPFRAVDSSLFASVVLGSDQKTIFQQHLSHYAPFEHFTIPENASASAYQEILSSLNARTVVVALHRLQARKGPGYGLTPQAEEFLKTLARKQKVVVVHFGTPYSLALTEAMPGVVCTYENNDLVQEMAAQVLFGARSAEGRLPVSAGFTLRRGLGHRTDQLERLRTGLPEEEGLSSARLNKIDSIANAIIRDHATPGCQILVARNGSVVYHKSFGYQTYDSLAPVQEETLYDIASITKVAATVQTLMHLQERGKIRLWDKASAYLPELAGTNKENLVLAEILVHQAGLQPFIPYWKRTLKTGDLSETFYCETRDNNWFNTEVVPGLYSMKTMEDTLWQWVLQSDLQPKNRKGGYDYKYSDLGYYILKKVAERVLEEPMESFLRRRVYGPLGLERLCFLPKRFFPETEIAPTENDTLFRQTLVRGNVHDPGAAMFGGVAGHAGLFSNAWSLAVLMQMNLNYGYYGGKYVLLPQTVPFFAQRHFPRNRRGLGWDKPYLWSKDGPTSPLASGLTFGHTGFTGTAVWADPKYNLIFVFLSNRVYPDAENAKLIKGNIRPKIQDMVYQAMMHPAEIPAILPPDTLGTE